MKRVQYKFKDTQLAKYRFIRWGYKDRKHLKVWAAQFLESWGQKCCSSVLGPIFYLQRQWQRQGQDRLTADLLLDSTLQAEAQLQPLRPFLRSEASHCSVEHVGTTVGENVPGSFFFFFCSSLNYVYSTSAALLMLFCPEQPAFNVWFTVIDSVRSHVTAH